MITGHTNPFDRNTLPRRLAPGRYALDFDESFMGVASLFGGVTLAAATRAALAELGDPTLRVRSIKCVYLASIKAGTATAEVRILRRGRSATHVAVSVHSADRHALELLLIVAPDRAAFSFAARTMPSVPPPEACRPFLEAPPEAASMAPPFWAKTPLWTAVDRRVAAGHHWWEQDWEPTSSFGAMWLRLRNAPTDEVGGLLSAVALTDVAGQSIAEQVGPAAPRWAMTSGDHSVHPFSAPTSDWILLSYEANRAEDGFASVATHAWDQSGALLATATQVILVFLLDGA